MNTIDPSTIGLIPSDERAVRLMLGPCPTASTEPTLNSKTPQAPMWRVTVLYGVLTAKYSNSRGASLSYMVQCEPKDISRLAKPFAIERMRRDNIQFDRDAVQVSFEKS